MMNQKQENKIMLLNEFCGLDIKEYQASNDSEKEIKAINFVLDEAYVNMSEENYFSLLKKSEFEIWKRKKEFIISTKYKHTIDFKINADDFPGTKSDDHIIMWKHDHFINPLNEENTKDKNATNFKFNNESHKEEDL